MIGIETINIEILKFDEKGLVTVVVQDAISAEVLMVAWANAESLRLTAQSGELVLWSRSRGELWHKGGTSGNVMKVAELRVDCDGDTLLALVHPAGPACHTGQRSCFFQNDIGRRRCGSHDFFGSPVALS